jgi:tocopherol O-methyltransferase
MNFKNFSSKDIAQYYDVSEDHYRYFWDLNQSHALHYGYWDDSTKTFREALANINQVLANKADIQSGMHVLDAGCGIGGSSIWLAQHKHTSVTGITLSAKQAARANNIAQELDLNKIASFQVQDYTNTNFENNTFDIVWAIESICHADDKKKFVKEAFRLLKPGGTLIMADFFIVNDGTEKEQDELNKWAHGWAVPFFEKKNIFERYLIESGFEKIEMTNATIHIIKSAKRLYVAFFPGWILSKVYNLLHKNTTEFSKKNVYTAYFQYKTLKKGLWEYCIVKAVK